MHTCTTVHTIRTINTAFILPLFLSTGIKKGSAYWIAWLNRAHAYPYPVGTNNKKNNRVGEVDWKGLRYALQTPGAMKHYSYISNKFLTWIKYTNDVLL